MKKIKEYNVIAESKMTPEAPDSIEEYNLTNSNYEEQKIVIAEKRLNKDNELLSNESISDNSKQ